MGESPPQAFCISPVSSKGIKNHVYKVAQLPPVFGASIIKVLIKTTQNTTWDFYIFLLFLCLAWQRFLCTHLVCFHASSADTNVQHIVLVIMLAPIYRLLSFLLLPCLKTLPKWRYSDVQYLRTHRMGNFILRGVSLLHQILCQFSLAVITLELALF